MAQYLIVTRNSLPVGEVLHAATGIGRADPAAQLSVVVTANPVSRGLTWSEGESRAVARDKARELRAGLEAAKMSVRCADTGAESGLDAIDDLRWSGHAFDELIIAGTPNRLLGRLRMDVWSRARRRFGVPVTAVVTASLRSPVGERNSRQAQRVAANS